MYARSWRVPDSEFVHDPAVAALLDLEGGVPVVYQGHWATYEPETSWNGDWEIVGEAGRLLWSGSKEDRGIGEVVFESWGGSRVSPSNATSSSWRGKRRCGALRAAIETASRRRPPPRTT